MRTLLAAMMLSLGSLASAQVPSGTDGAGAQLLDMQAIVSRYGTIIDKQLVGIGGLTAWTVEKNGRRVVLYSTPDSEALFTGVLWDAKSGVNVSDRFRPRTQPAHLGVPEAQPLAPPVRAVAAMDGEFPGEIPESIATIDGLAGFKEGQGGPADTVYIVFDPRCPYCRAAYRGTRAYVAKGATIKWIPAVALGNPQDGIPLAATVLQSDDPEVLARVLGGHEPIQAEPTPETLAHLDTNFDFLLAAFEQNGGTAGVPAAFFLDHRTGAPRMMTGVSEQMILQDIFGEP